MENDGRTFLKVKIKSLADESRTIRKEERKAVGETRERLHLHRVNEVRFEARATHLAYAFIRGKKRSCCESKVLAMPDSIRKNLEKKVSSMSSKYGQRDVAELVEWFNIQESDNAV